MLDSYRSLTSTDTMTCSDVVSADQPYSTQAWCSGHTLVDHDLQHDLEARVWTHNGTTWVALSGQLTDEAAGCIARLLLAERDSSAVVINVDELALEASDDQRLLKLCADLSIGGRSACIVGPEAG